MSDLVLLRCGHLERCTVRVDRTLTGGYSLQAMSAGAIYWSCGGPLESCTGAWCWGTPPGKRRRYGPAPAPGWWDHRYVVFSGPLADRWQLEGLIPDAPEPMPDPIGFTRGFDRLLSLMQAGTACAQRLGINQLERLLVELAARRQGAPPPDDPLIEAITAAGDPEHGADLRELARLARCSVVHLRRRFLAATGQTPGRYMQAARLRHARSWLAETDMPIKVIAERLGYSDTQHFTRSFAADAGSPPAAWRRRARG